MPRLAGRKERKGEETISLRSKTLTLTLVLQGSIRSFPTRVNRRICSHVFLPPLSSYIWHSFFPPSSSMLPLTTCYTACCCVECFILLYLSKRDFTIIFYRRHSSAYNISHFLSNPVKFNISYLAKIQNHRNKERLRRV